MKEAKVIHINDGTGKELTNGNRHFAEELTWAGEMLTMYLNAGYEIAGLIPDYTPSMGGEGVYNFYKTGFTAIMTRELTDESVTITKDDWDNYNTSDEYSEYEYFFGNDVESDSDDYENEHFRNDDIDWDFDFDLD